MVSEKVLHFAFIGCVAFVFDATAYFLAGLLFLVLLGQGAPFLQKIIGFAVGVLTTYLYNSRITFSVSYSRRRFWLYISSQLLGMAVNLVVFLILNQVLPVLAALISATLLAAIVNFIGARRSLRVGQSSSNCATRH